MEKAAAKKKTVKKIVKKTVDKVIKTVKASKAEKVITDTDDDKTDKPVKSLNNGKTRKVSNVLAGKELVDAIVSVLEDKLAEKIAVIDLRKVSATADWFVICQGDNTSHTSAVANEVIGVLKEKYKTAPWHHEGVEDGRWALIDYTDVVVHVMLEEVREYYNLEGLWG